MNLAVDPVEGFWIAILLIAFAITIGALIDAIDNRRAVTLLNGHARELASSGTVRREFLRLIVQALLLSIAVPGLFSDRPIVLSPILVALILVPVVLLVSTLVDARDRRRLTVITAAELVIERDSDIRQLRRDIAENTRISQAASDHADKAYHEANSVNEKIASQGAVLVRQGERQDAADARDAAVIETIDTTAEQVADLHEGTAPDGRSA